MTMASLKIGETCQHCGQTLQALPTGNQRSNGWVRIEDIPEEWKDGRPVDLWCKDTRYADCKWSYELDYWSFKADEWANPRWVTVPIVPAHAMLPTPPNECEVKYD